MNDIRENLKAYLDGELSAAECEAVQRAVEADPQLQKECDQMKLISNSMRASSENQAAPGKQAVLDQFTSRRAGRPWWRKPWGYALAGVSCLLLAIVMFPVFTQAKEASKKLAPWSRTATSGAVSATPPAESVEMKKDMSAKVGDASISSERAVASPEPASVPNLNRDIVKTGAISVTVVDVIRAQADAKRLAVAAQGYVESSSLDSQGNYMVTASVVLRVPAARFDETVEKVRKFGEVTSETESGIDVTGQLVDLDARIATQKDQISSLREILRQARKLGEIIELRDRIAQIQAEVDSITQQRNVLKSQASLSTINVTFEEKLKPETSSGASKGWLEDTWAGAIQNLGAFGRVVGGLGVHILVYSPIWLPIVIVGWLIARRSKAS